MLMASTCAEADEAIGPARRLLDSYSQIKTLTCRIRKTTRAAGRTTRLLSRIHYQQPKHLHIENISPVQRRIIVDGKKLYYHEKNLQRGFSRPVGDLEGKWLSAVNDIPSTPVEHLLRLKTVAPNPLPGTDEAVERTAYHLAALSAVLHCDARGRLTQIEFYKSSALRTRTATTLYSSFHKVSDTCWIPTRHQTTLFLPDGESVTETRRIDNLIVNQPIAPHLFNAAMFFSDIEFVPDFKQTYSR